MKHTCPGCNRISYDHECRDVFCTVGRENFHAYQESQQTSKSSNKGGGGFFDGLVIGTAIAILWSMILDIIFSR